MVEYVGAVWIWNYLRKEGKNTSRCSAELLGKMSYRREGKKKKKRLRFYECFDENISVYFKGQNSD